MPKKTPKARVFSPAFKQEAVERMLGGENVSALARELEVRRKLLYEWRDAFRSGGPAGLRGAGRPSKQTAAAANYAGKGAHIELSAARKRLTELERQTQRQAKELESLSNLLRRLQDAQGTRATASLKRGAPIKAKRR